MEISDIDYGALRRWYAPARRNPNSLLRLYCLPYAGGGGSVFSQWWQDLEPSVEVCPIQLPGRETRIGEPPCTSIWPLVNGIVRALRSETSKPFALFGHSMGAIIGFEVARAMRGVGGDGPVHLFVSGARAPHIPRNEAPLHKLPDIEFIERLREFGGTPDEVMADAEIMRVMCPLLRADFSVCETYAYTEGRPLDCPITVFGGSHDPYVANGDLWSWRDQTTQSLNLHILPGGHFFLRTARAVLLRLLRSESQEVIRRQFRASSNDESLTGLPIVESGAAANGRNQT